MIALNRLIRFVFTIYSAYLCAVLTCFVPSAFPPQVEQGLQFYASISAPLQQLDNKVSAFVEETIAKAAAEAKAASDAIRAAADAEAAAAVAELSAAPPLQPRPRKASEGRRTPGNPFAPSPSPEPQPNSTPTSAVSPFSNPVAIAPQSAPLIASPPQRPVPVAASASRQAVPQSIQTTPALDSGAVVPEDPLDAAIGELERRVGAMMRVLSNGNGNGFDAQWKAMQTADAHRWKPALCSVGLAPHNKERNRYRDILPMDIARVKLKVGAFPPTVWLLRFLHNRRPWGP